jgi:hypothetical protein
LNLQFAGKNIMPMILHEISSSAVPTVKTSAVFTVLLLFPSHLNYLPGFLYFYPEDGSSDIAIMNLKSHTCDTFGWDFVSNVSKTMFNK